MVNWGGQDERVDVSTTESGTKREHSGIYEYLDGEHRGVVCLPLEVSLRREDEEYHLCEISLEVRRTGLHITSRSGAEESLHHCRIALFSAK